MAKLGWRLLTEPNALWARVLRHKYCNGRCDLDMFNSKSNSSNIWKGILEGVPVLKKGLRSSIGNGNRTMFWSHCWATSVPLEDLTATEIPIEQQDVSVGEMWDTQTGWKWELFADFFTPDILRTIASYEVRPYENTRDNYFWDPSATGTFTIKSALQLLRNDLPENEGAFWKLPWRTWAPQKMRIFLWLLLHDRIMSNANRMKRGLTEDPLCGVCGAEESSIHILRDCPKARRVWNYFPLQGAQEEISLRDWVIKNITYDALIEVDMWPTVFTVIVWWLWRWQNLRTFGNEENLPPHDFLFLKQQIEDVKLAKTRMEPFASNREKMHKEIYIKWLIPPANWIALNVDGASRGNPGEAGAGGVFRDSAGHLLSAFSEKLGMATVTRAEIMALRRGLILAKENWFTKVIVQTDSQALVQMLKNKEARHLVHSNQLLECIEIMNSDGMNVEVQHVYREANSCADWMANRGIEQGDRIEIITEPPLPLYRLLVQDLQGVAWPRKVLFCFA